METNKIEQTIRSLIDVFFDAGKLSLDLRAKGLTEHIKKDKTPVKTTGSLKLFKGLKPTCEKDKNANPILKRLNRRSGLDSRPHRSCIAAKGTRANKNDQSQIEAP